MSHDLIAFLNMLDVRCTGVIQVGANTGQELSLFRKAGLDRGVLIEPLPAPFAALSNAVAHLPDFLPVQALCTDKDDELCTFHVADNEDGLSSSVLAPGRHAEFYPGIRFENTLQIRSVTLDTLMAKLTAEGLVRDPRDYDLLFMDTQGAELMVLRGGMNVLNGTKAVWTEVSHGGLYQGDVRLPDLIAFFDRAGFDLYRLVVGRKTWGDALFVRRSAARPTRGTAVG